MFRLMFNTSRILNDNNHKQIISTIPFHFSQEKHGLQKTQEDERKAADQSQNNESKEQVEENDAEMSSEVVESNEASYPDDIF